MRFCSVILPLMCAGMLGGEGGRGVRLDPPASREKEGSYVCTTNWRAGKSPARPIAVDAEGAPTCVIGNRQRLLPDGSQRGARVREEGV